MLCGLLALGPACSDPGGEALEAIVVAAEQLVAKIEISPGPLDPHALEAWIEDVRPGLLAIVREDARALGPARRDELQGRWTRAREALMRRLDAAR
ncbi:MAG: hypothetical protein IT385_24540 [Deltaproteobacteria bacterium]|nr:hypothetical protein [Deltaproteobacteria bacterium]